jgi:hypothetical protein
MGRTEEASSFGERIGEARVADGAEYGPVSVGGGTVEVLPPVTREAELAALETAREARWTWPYLDRTLSCASNGRETGCFIAGLLYARSQGAVGMRVTILEDHLAGCVALLTVAGVACVMFSHPLQDAGEARRVTIDVWIESGGEATPNLSPVSAS